MQEAYDTALALFIRDIYTSEDLSALCTYLESQGTFEFVPLASGLYPATPATTQEGGRYRYVWVRDNVHIAHALYRAGRVDEAIRVAHALMTYFDKVADRFEAVIERRVDKDDPHVRPHVRFDGDTLSEVDERWPHAQNDAHGLFLWIIGTLVEDGALELDQRTVRTVARTIRYLAALPFYADLDSGAWEEVRAVRASSIGAVCAGLSLWAELLHDYDHALSHQAHDLYQQGREAYERIFPAESVGERDYDAALLFLIEPLNLLTTAQADLLLGRVRDRLWGEKGIKRYEGDAFWGPDYDTLSPALRTANASEDDTFRREYSVFGKEAQWTLFDPLIARYFAKRYEESADQADAVRAAEHLNRSLAALVRTQNGALLMPELYYYHSGVLVPNTIVPLYWAQANLLLALSTDWR